VRFRLDPKEADEPVEVAPPRAPVPGRPAPPPHPSPTIAPVDANRSKKRLIVVAILGILLLSGGATAVLYATDSGPFKYPHANLVEGSAVPSGLRLASIPAEIRDEYGIETNPGPVNDDNLDQLSSATGQRPDKAWVEVLGTRTRQDAITVFALDFKDTDAASAFRQTAQFKCSTGGFAVLQDGDVVVMVVVGDSSALTYFSQVVSKIVSQVSELKLYCG
jgi:hypothetical protein